MYQMRATRLRQHHGPGLPMFLGMLLGALAGGLFGTLAMWAVYWDSLGWVP